MTGWAQVHGLGGETSAVEQMRLGVQYDLDYLRNGSLWLDFKVMARTAFIVLFSWQRLLRDLRQRPPMARSQAASTIHPATPGD